MQVTHSPAIAGGALIATVLLCSCAGSRPPSGRNAVPEGWPVSGEHVVVSSSYGARRSGSRHQGIDFSAPKRTPVRATADGVVSFADRAGDYGRMVIIDHGGGIQTAYAHLHRIKVRNGRNVRRGDTIGSVGKSGNATGTHVHYEVRRDGKPTDPRPFL